MGSLADFILVRLGDSAGTMLAMLVFLPAALLAFWVMSTLKVRGAVRRRAAGMIDDSAAEGGGSRSLRHSSVKAAQRMLEYTAKHYGSTDNNKDLKLLRRRMVLAGIYDQRAVGIFFAARTALAVGLTAAAFFAVPMFLNLSGSTFWLVVGLGGLAGYMGPTFYLNRRIASRREEHRAGFRIFWIFSSSAPIRDSAWKPRLRASAGSLPIPIPRWAPISISRPWKSAPAAPRRKRSSIWGTASDLRKPAPSRP